MSDIGRRKLLKNTSILAGFSIIAGFPTLFPVAATADTKKPPPRPTDKSKKVVSSSKPKTDKPKTDKKAEKPKTDKPKTEKKKS
jgi:hypothetical protein